MTSEEVASLARQLADGWVAPDQVPWDRISSREAGDVIAAACCLLRERRSRKPQRRAMRLLQSWLTYGERAELRRNRYVTVTGTAGGRYRVIPSTGTTQRVERHGSRWFATATYCLHPDEWIPPADVALAHYLSILTNEGAFLRAANEHRTDLWDGAYLRRLHAARRARSNLTGET
jgi:hypothetical protein